ncbi:hypothetical protein BpHYR1_045079, partial [Brachionus plicatilis]
LSQTSTGQKKRSNASLQFVNSNELLDGTPEKVRQDYLEKSAIKSEPTNKCRKDDQIGFSGNIRGRSFPNTGRNLYSRSGQVHHGLKSLRHPEERRTTNKWWNRFKSLDENNKIVEANLRNCVATFLHGNCLRRFEFRVYKGPVDRFELEKQMVKMFGQQPASQTDSSRYDYLVKERFITGLNEKAVFWRVDVSNPQTCSEAYDLVVQTYARLQILNRNQPNPIISEKMGDQENAYQGNPQAC